MAVNFGLKYSKKFDKNQIKLVIIGENWENGIFYRLADLATFYRFY
jgi:hypothetical protein